MAQWKRRGNRSLRRVGVGLAGHRGGAARGAVPVSGTRACDCTFCERDGTAGGGALLPGTADLVGGRDRDLPPCRSLPGTPRVARAAQPTATRPSHPGRTCQRPSSATLCARRGHRGRQRSLIARQPHIHRGSATTARGPRCRAHSQLAGSRTRCRVGRQLHSRAAAPA